MAQRADRPEDAYAKRLAAAQADVDTKRKAYEKAMDVRNRLVFEAIDEAGLSERWVARALGLSKGLVHGVLAGGEP